MKYEFFQLYNRISIFLLISEGQKSSSLQIMGKVKPMKSEPSVTSQSILLDDFALTTNGPRCTPAGHPTSPSTGDSGANDNQNIPVISVTSINHPHEAVTTDARKTGDSKRVSCCHLE